MLLRTQISPNTDVLSTSRCWFVMPTSVWSRFPKQAQRNVRVETLPVFDEPMDGLPAAIDPWPTAAQKKQYLELGGEEAYIGSRRKEFLREEGYLVPGEDFDVHDRVAWEKWMKSITE